MPRERKDGFYVNVRLKAPIYERLVQYCEQDDRTKTSVIERALTQYFDSLDFHVDSVDTEK